MEERKYPDRSCVGCRKKQEKGRLIRVVRSPEGEVSLDKTGRSPGRGAYLCPLGSCLETALKKGGLGKSLRCTLSQTQQEAIRKEFAGLEERNA